jgi:hypothetical protein
LCKTERKGKTAWIRTGDYNSGIRYHIVYHYGDDRNKKRGTVPLYYALYERMHGYKKNERNLGTFKDIEAAKDKAYEAYMEYHPGAVGRWVPKFSKE